MPTYDWPLIQQRSGDSIESLVATLLRREYSDARQVNPSQGDGGIDIVRPTPDGLEIWQVKGFTTAMSDGQFRQVARSWKTFVDEQVTPGERRIARYHLVTPWTPTQERVAQFEELTEGAPFPRQWDGDAFIAGLADRYPATMQRFTHGDGVLEQFISQKTFLASSPVERGDAVTMLEAIEARQDALDSIRDTVSDNYRIEHGTRTTTSVGEVPLPDHDDPAVYQRMTFLGDSRWRYESVVPRNPDAQEVDPISLNLEFLAEPGTSEHDAVRAWAEWGIPFTNVRVRSQTVGGPFSEGYPRESAVTIIEREDGEAPPLYLRCTAPDGTTRFRLPLVVTSRTAGAETGWMRLVVETPERSIRFEIRFKPRRENTARVEMGNVDGRNPESVRDELETLRQIGADDVLAVEASNRQPLVRANSITLPTVLEQLHLPVARHLTELQDYAASSLVMPSIPKITDSQFQYLSLIASIYSGTAHQWEWTQVTLLVPEDNDGVERIKKIATDALEEKGHLVTVEAPTFQLGNRTYTIDHVLASTAHSVRLEPGVDPTSLRPGDSFSFVPGTDASVTTAKVVDWTPGSIQLE